MKRNFLGIFLSVLPILSFLNANQSESNEYLLSPKNTQKTDHGYMFSSLEVFYMQNTIDGLAFSVSLNDQITITGAIVRGNPIDGQIVHDLDFSWAPGLRLNVGRHFLYDNWDAFLSYTHFNNRSTGESTIDNLAFQRNYALWIPKSYFGGTYSALKAEAEWCLDLNVIDVILQKSFKNISFLTLSPFLGLRAAMIHQNFTANYLNGRLPFGVDNSPDANFIAKNDFDGWGIYSGVNTLWNLTDHWGIYARSAVSFLYGRFKVKENANKTGSISRSLLSESSQIFTNATSVDVGVGIAWSMLFSETNRLSLSLGYEMMQWFKQNKIVIFSYVDNTPGAGYFSNGDLGINGLNLSAALDF